MYQPLPFVISYDSKLMLAIFDLRNPINLVALQHHSSWCIHVDSAVDNELHFGSGVIVTAIVWKLDLHLHKQSVLITSNP